MKLPQVPRVGGCHRAEGDWTRYARPSTREATCAHAPRPSKLSVAGWSPSPAPVPLSSSPWCHGDGVTGAPRGAISDLAPASHRPMGGPSVTPQQPPETAPSKSPPDDL